MAILAEKHSVMYAKKILAADATTIANLSSTTQDDLDAAAKALMVVENRFTGILEATGGGLTTGSDSITAWGPDSLPQPIPQDTTLNDFSVSGYYDQDDITVVPTDQSGLPEHDERLLNAIHGEEWVFVTAMRKASWADDTFLIMVRRGFINNTDDIQQTNPLSFSLGAQQNGRTLRKLVDIS